MNSRSGRDGNNNSSRRTKAIAAIPMAGILVAAGLLSGLALASTSLSQVAIAQNLTAGGGATNATMGTNATTAGGGGGNQSAVSEATMHINEAMSAAQSGDMQGVMMHLRLALNVLGNMTSTTTTAAAGGNMTGTTGGTTMTQSNQNNVI